MIDGPQVVYTHVATGHSDLLVVCSQLEAIADGLPDDFDRHSCLALAKTLSQRLSAVQAFEEETWFPRLLSWHTLGDEMGLIIDDLHRDHQMDLFQAEEIQEMLAGYADGRPDIAHDAAGFMLRALFEGLRRHIRLEQALLLPLTRLRHDRRSAPLPVPVDPC